MQSYTPAEQGGYKEGMSVHEKYHSWAAAQYREKVDSYYRKNCVMSDDFIPSVGCGSSRQAMVPFGTTSGLRFPT
jgi:hypothetical protein